MSLFFVYYYASKFRMNPLAKPISAWRQLCSRSGIAIEFIARLPLTTGERAEF
ncbi:MAG: hypothetical protein LBI74_07115 [Synergistaceae bacterium]|jgi:hypothetical protein|nr:hypothetical protein [Synergistaceae bacterium]